jgi:hypothetical protein
VIKNLKLPKPLPFLLREEQFEKPKMHSCNFILNIVLDYRFSINSMNESLVWP